MKRWILAMLCLSWTIVGCEGSRAPATAPASAGSAPKSEPGVDNTGVNTRDRENGTKTPFDQGESKSDVAMTAEIRKLVVDAKMSTDAKNVKIICENGHVVLRGPVDSDDEKTRIGQIAEKVAGATNVDNQLDVSDQQ